MTRILAVFAALFMALSPAQAGDEHLELPAFPKARVMVLGTYHMANPGKDEYNVAADDVLSQKRQGEIAELVAALAAFKPTKIAVEAPYGSTRTVEEYQAYLEGEYQLQRNETDQIGFRLAKMLGHETVYPVDYSLDMSEGVDTSDPRYGAEFGETLAEMGRYGKAAEQLLNEKLSGMTVGTYLRWMNSPEMIEANHFFYTGFLMQNGAGDWLPGPRMVANWYTRNLLITHNILRIREGDGSDRILAIFGQGHAKLLKQFLDESPHFELVEVNQYLPE